MVGVPFFFACNFANTGASASERIDLPSFHLCKKCVRTGDQEKANTNAIALRSKTRTISNDSRRIRRLKVEQNNKDHRDHKRHFNKHGANGEKSRQELFRSKEMHLQRGIQQKKKKPERWQKKDVVPRPKTIHSKIDIVMKRKKWICVCEWHNAPERERETTHAQKEGNKTSPWIERLFVHEFLKQFTEPLQIFPFGHTSSSIGSTAITSVISGIAS